jgi:probable addiction module antidote protein
MAKTATTRYDVAEHLRTQEEMAAYLEACFDEANGDAAFIAKALGDIARAKGMSQVAKDAGLSRESLYKALSGERSPGFDTILKVIGALGLKLHAQAARSLRRRPIHCSGRCAMQARTTGEFRRCGAAFAVVGPDTAGGRELAHCRFDAFWRDTSTPYAGARLRVVRVERVAVRRTA